MKNSKTFFLVPGFLGQFDRSFWLVDFLESKKIKVVLVPIHWKHRVLSQNAEELALFFDKHKGKENYVLGFSYGAVLTLLTANQIKPKKIFLCSLSPAFREDSVSEKRWKKYIGKRRYEDSKNRSAIELAKNLSMPSVVFCGEAEAKQYPQLKKRCEQTTKLAKSSKLITVKNAPHKLDFPEYITAIKKELSKI